jgi:hypothetical protein
VFQTDQAPSATLSLILANTLSPNTAYRFNLNYNSSLSSPGINVQHFNVRTDGTFTTGAAVPEIPLPAALPLFATGIGGLGLLGWRRKRRAKAVAEQKRLEEREGPP